MRVEGSAVSPVQRDATWQHRVEALQAHGRLPSVVAGVLQDGRLVWSGGVNASVDDAYRIGSITKTLTAVAVLQLREDGALSLDDRLGRFLPGTGYDDATLRGLLSHTAGLQSEPAGPWWERSPGVDLATLLAAHDGSGAVAGPGEWFHYSNLGYGLLGAVVARLRDESWEQVVATRLLEPLGMTRTTYHPRAPHASGHSVDHFAGTLADEPHHDTGAMAPAGQLWSTVGDLARWAAFLVEGHPDVLPLGVLHEMGRAVAPADSYGLGLRRLRHDGPVAGRPHRLDARLPGHAVRRPRRARRRGRALRLHRRAAGGVGAGHPARQRAGGGARPAPRRPSRPGRWVPVGPVEPWVPSTTVPDQVRELLGLWFWGNTACELRWHNQRLHLRVLATGALSDVLEVRDDGRVVGQSGYHRGETLHVVRREDGGVSHLVCATFVYTRVPYDPAVDLTDPGVS